MRRIAKSLLSVIIFFGALGAHAIDCHQIIVYVAADFSERIHLVNFFADAAKNSILHRSPVAARQHNVVQEHVFGNELDYAKAPVDHEESDLVAGTGSNALWMTAVRANAKQMVLIDRGEGPAIVNEFFWKPLAAVSNSPAELVCSMFGFDVPPGLEHAPLHEVWDYIEQLRTDAKTMPERRQLRDRLNEAFNRRLTVYYRQQPSIIRKGIDDVLKPTLASAVHNFPALDPFFWGNVRSGAEIYLLFRQTYIDPSRAILTASGDSPLRDPFLNPFASIEAYTRWRRLIDNSQYIVGNIYSPVVTDTLAKVVGDRGYRSVTMAHSNIVDAGYSAAEVDAELNAIDDRLQAWANNLGLTFVKVLHTRGRKSDAHEYEVHRLNGANGANGAPEAAPPAAVADAAPAKRAFHWTDLIPKFLVSETKKLSGQYSLGELPPGQFKAVRREIIQLAQTIYDRGKAEGKDTLFPIPPSLYDEIIAADATTSFSQVVLDDNGHVAGFFLARFSESTDAAHIEKIAVVPELRETGLMKRMMYAAAKRCKAYGIPRVDLLVTKQNAPAIAAYEKLGFLNATPEEARQDPDVNAFLFEISTKDLLQRTAPR